MSKTELNGHTTFLRTQSYIVNGQPNPLSNISRNKYFSRYANINNEKNKKKKKDKSYIYLIKKQQKKKSYSSNKSHKKIFIKKNNKNKKEDYEQNDIKSYTEKNLNELNDSFKDKDSFQKKKENSKEKLHKTKNNFLNNVQKNLTKIPYYDFSKVIQKKDININNLNNQYNYTAGNIKDSNKIFFSDLNNKNKNLFSNTTKLEFPSRQNSLDKKDNLYSSVYSQKKKKNNKVILSTYKDESYINKILFNDDDCILINGHMNKNKLLSKLNHYTKKEKYSYRANTKKATKNLLKSMKKYLNTEIASYKSSISKINEIPRSKNILNFYDSMGSSLKNYINFNNSIKNISKYSQLRNNKCCLISSEYYNINSKKDFFKNEIKDEFGELPQLRI